jgi:hypothetical protein
LLLPVQPSEHGADQQPFSDCAYAILNSLACIAYRLFCGSQLHLPVLAILPAGDNQTFAIGQLIPLAVALMARHLASCLRADKYLF